LTIALFCHQQPLTRFEGMILEISPLWPPAMNTAHMEYNNMWVC